MSEAGEGIRLDSPALDQPARSSRAATATRGRSLRRLSERVLVRSRVRIWLPPLVVFAIAAVVWDAYASGHPYVLPTIGDIWRSLAHNTGMYWSNFETTLREVAIGAAGGIVFAFLLAVIMAELPIIERAVMPFMVTLMVTPVVAIAPALVIAFGFGSMPKYVVTGLVVFFPMLVNSVAGLRDVDARTLDVFTTLHASRWEVFRHLRLPGSMPFVFAGLRIALPLAVVGATVAEFAAAGQESGLGALITVASSQANLAVIWSGIVLLCALGVGLVAVLALIRGRVLWWDNEAALNTRGQRRSGARTDAV
jgi:NitT/TauT family transport system permease protein